jgi:hypothetical protein
MQMKLVVFIASVVAINLTDRQQHRSKVSVMHRALRQVLLFQQGANAFLKVVPDGFWDAVITA